MARQQRLRRIAKYAGAVVAAFVVAVPLAFVTTILLFPFWSWLESRFGIESIGHSGPDDWCFEAMYGLVALTLSWGAVRWIAVSRDRSV